MWSFVICFFHLAYFQVHPYCSTCKLLLLLKKMSVVQIFHTLDPSIDGYKLLPSSATINSADLNIGMQLSESLLSVFLSVCL